MLLECVATFNLRGTFDLAGVADAIIRLSKDFFEVDFLKRGFLFMLTGVFGGGGIGEERTLWLLISRNGLLMHTAGELAGEFSILFSKRFSLVFIFGETIRRATLSFSRGVTGVCGEELGSRMATINFGR